MRRASRNTPLWILTGAAVVVLAANFNSRNDEERAAEKSAAPVKAAMASPAAAADETPAPHVKPLEPLLTPKPAAVEPAETTPDDAETAPVSDGPVGSAGMVVGIDPETGRVGMPSREFLDAVRDDPRGPAMSRSVEGLRVIHKPDGSKMVDLEGRFQEYSVVRITPDGRKEQSCVQGSGVAAALTGTANEDPDADSTSNDDTPGAEPETVSDSPVR